MLVGGHDCYFPIKVAKQSDGLTPDRSQIATYARYLGEILMEMGYILALKIRYGPAQRTKKRQAATAEIHKKYSNFWGIKNNISEQRKTSQGLNTFVLDT